MLSVILTVAVGASYWMGRQEEGFRPDKNLFRDYEIELVDEVILRSPQDTIHLKYTGTSWVVNDVYPADRDRIRVLFATLQQAEPKRPVATSLKDSIARVLTTQGVHVIARSNQEDVQRFAVGGNTARSETYFKREDSDEPYLMIIPGYRVYVGGIFEMNESGWRDKYIFKVNWENFRQLESHFRNPAGDFKVVMEDRRVSVEGVTQVDTAKLNSYMDYLSLIKIDEYVPTTPQLDSLSKTAALAKFSVTDIGGREFSLQVFERRQGNAVYALLNGTQWAVIQEDRIFPILRPKEFFIKR